MSELPQQPDRPNSLASAIERVQNFVNNELPQISDVRARQESVRFLAQSMPSTLSDDDQADLTINFDRALAANGDPQPWMRLIPVWDSSLPAPVGNPIVAISQSQIREFALTTIANLTDEDEIAEAIADFVPSVSNAPSSMTQRLYFEFEWHTRDRPDHSTLIGLFYMQLVPDSINDSAPNPSSGFDWFDPQDTSLLADDWSSAYVSSDVDGGAAANELIDLGRIRYTLQARLDVMLTIVEDLELELDTELCSSTTLWKIDNDLNNLFPLTEDGQAISPEEALRIPSVRTFIDTARNIGGQVKTELAHVEGYLINMEQIWLTQPETQLQASASRLQRRKFQHIFKSIIKTLKTEDLKQLNYSSVLPHLSGESVTVQTRPYDEDHDCCPICSEEYAISEPGKPTIPPIVTHTCCNRPSHVECLMSWFYDNESTGAETNIKSCPMCRTEMRDEFLSELLEWKAKEYESL